MKKINDNKTNKIILFILSFKKKKRKDKMKSIILLVLLAIVFAYNIQESPQYTSKIIRRVVRRRNEAGTHAHCTGGECVHYKRVGCVKYRNPCIHTTSVCAKKIRVCAQHSSPKCVKGFKRCRKHRGCRCVQHEFRCTQYQKHPVGCKVYVTPCVLFKVVCSKRQKVCVKKGKCVCQKYAPRRCVERCPRNILRERRAYCRARTECKFGKYRHHHRRFCSLYRIRCGPGSYLCKHRVRRCKGRRSKHCLKVYAQCRR